MSAPNLCVAISGQNFVFSDPDGPSKSLASSVKNPSSVPSFFGGHFSYNFLALNIGRSSFLRHRTQICVQSVFSFFVFICKNMSLWKALESRRFSTSFGLLHSLPRRCYNFQLWKSLETYSKWGFCRGEPLPSTRIICETSEFLVESSEMTWVRGWSYSKANSLAVYRYILSVMSFSSNSSLLPGFY